MIPEKLEDWTYEIIAELVKKNVCESDRHEFKSNIPDSDTLSRVCCAFANTKGGFIILGVKQTGSGFTIEGIDNDSELAHKFGQKINVTPMPDFDLPVIIATPKSGKVIAVFHIPLSPQRPLMTLPKDKGFFWKRTNKGNDQMTFEEISMSFQNYEQRREKLRLLYVELLFNLEQLKKMIITEADSSDVYSVVTLDSTTINSLLSDLFTIIGKNVRLIQILFTFRAQTRIINNKIQLFYASIALPQTNIKQIIKEHNDFVKGRVEELIPLIVEATNILESAFNLKNPLKE